MAQILDQVRARGLVSDQHHVSIVLPGLRNDPALEIRVAADLGKIKAAAARALQAKSWNEIVV